MTFPLSRFFELVSSQGAMRRGGALLAVGAGVALLGGCISSGPELSAGRAVQEGGVVRIPIAAANKTDQPMPLRKIEYTVSVDGAAPVSVVRSAEATVHSLTTQMIELPVPAAAGARTYTISGEVIYIPRRKFWKVMYDEEIHRPGVSFSFSGEIDQAAALPIPASDVPAATPATSPLAPTEPQPVK